ncbi:MAG: DUF3857 domain-containing protein [Acidobacteriia bacterium]|nr:DUF3857 domain-containing protein [Terriglobia bacterium]
MAILLLASSAALRAQAPPSKPPEKISEAPAAARDTAAPYTIELLETRVRFDADGSSRREVHARARLHTEAGARQFARLNFDYHRAFEQIEIPLVRITHASGGVADILPSAVTDRPNPAVADFPAYQDVRRKSVRILGLQPGDVLEYRVITSVAHAPLAPDFYLAHTFAHDSVITQEVYELDLPAGRTIQLRVNPATPAASTESSGEGSAARVVYRWQRTASAEKMPPKESPDAEPDVVLTSFASWEQLAARLAALLEPPATPAREIASKAAELTHSGAAPADNYQAIYEFVAQKIPTVDLPLGSTGFRARLPAEILASGYATPEDKAVLFAALAAAAGLSSRPALTGAPASAATQLPRPSLFTHLLLSAAGPAGEFWLDLSVEVAPFRMIPAALRGQPALLLRAQPSADAAPSGWTAIPAELPFAASQRVTVNATLAADGTLSARVHYALRGDNELLLRVAFHQTPREKWKGLAQLLAYSDGFRGAVAEVTASDPASTREPFTLEYQIAQPAFVDWTKQPVRIPALLPLVGLPELPARPAAGAAAPPIELGTPLDIEARATLRLPPRTLAQAPAGTSVHRDYAVYTSSYVAQGSILRAARRVRFLLREIPAARNADYSAFTRAVQNDESQLFTLERPATPAPKTKPAAPKPPAAAKPHL